MSHSKQLKAAIRPLQKKVDYEYGTAYFPSRDSVIHYYRNNCGGGGEEALEEGRVFVGQPPPEAGTQLRLDHEEQRWVRQVLLKEKNAET